MQSAVLAMIDSVRLIICLTVCPRDRLSHAGIMPKRLSYDYAVFTEGSPVTLISSRLTSPQNSKGNMGSEGAE